MERRVRVLLAISKILQWAIVALSFISLIGWQINSYLLKRLVIGSNSINPLTAILFLVTTLVTVKHSKHFIKVFLVLQGAVILLCIFKLIDFTTALPFKVDHLFFGDFFGGKDQVNPMAPSSAILFILIGIVQIATYFNKRNVREGILVVLLLLDVFLIAGYLMNVPEFYLSIPLFPAPQTCILFLLTISSIYLAEPDKGLPSLLIKDLEGAKVGRLIIPLIVLIPLAIGYLRLMALRAGTYSNELAIALVVLCYIIIFSAIFFVIVQYLNKKDQLRNHFIGEIKALNIDLNDSNNQQLVLNEELAASNEEVQASNEELTAMNEKLSDALQTIREQNALILQQKEEALLRSKQHLDIIFSNTKEEILLLDAEGRVIAYNASLKKFILMTTGKLPKVGMYVWDITVPERHTESQKIFKLALQGQTVSREIPVKTSKEELIYSIRYEPVIVEGKVTHVTIVSRNITEQVVASEKLKKSFEELEKVNHELDRFVYSASHDLRAPLSSILGLINLAEMEANGKESTYLQMIKGRIHHLDGFIKDILDYSRNARSEISFKEIDFNAILQESDVSLRLISSYEKLKFIFEVKIESVFFSDPLRLSIIFNNLISNAIKFQDHNKLESFLSVIISANEKEAYVKVKDNGIGIDAQHLSKIFNMFYRGTERSNGSGIGLYIVKETVEKLGGSISVESVLGAYTLFEMKIPNAVQNATTNNQISIDQNSMIEK